MTLLLTLILLLGGSIPARSQPFSAQIVRALQVYGFTSPGVLTIDTGCSPVAYSFAGDTDTGFCRSAADTVAAYAGGISRWDYNTTRILSTLPIYLPAGIVTAPSGTFDGDADTGIFNPFANYLGFVAGTTQAAALQGNGFELLNASSLLWVSTIGSSANTRITRSNAQQLDVDNGSGTFNTTFRAGIFAQPARTAVTVDAATTFAITSGTIVLACTGAETINTITGGVAGMKLLIEHTDTDCTIADDDDPTAANAIDLTGTATNDVGAVGKIIELFYNGTSWLQVAESDN